MAVLAGTPTGIATTADKPVTQRKRPAAAGLFFGLVIGDNDNLARLLMLWHREASARAMALV
jgi:hypothetical protein